MFQGRDGLRRRHDLRTSDREGQSSKVSMDLIRVVEDSDDRFDKTSGINDENRQMVLM